MHDTATCEQNNAFVNKNTSVCPSVCLSLHLSHLYLIVPLINFQQLLPLTKEMPMQRVKVRGNFKITEFKTNFALKCKVTWAKTSDHYEVNLFMATAGDVWIIPSFQIWDMCCMLSTFNVSSQIVANISESSVLFSQWLFRLCWRKTLSENYYPYPKNFFFKISLFQVAFFIFFPVAIFSPYFLLVGLLLQSVALFQCRELIKHLESM